MGEGTLVGGLGLIDMVCSRLLLRGGHRLNVKTMTKHSRQRGQDLVFRARAAAVDDRCTRRECSSGWYD